MGFLKKMAKIISNKKYRRNPDEKVLAPEKYIALNVGAINAEQVMYYCDSIKTGADIVEIKKNCADYYGIVNREIALETLDWLKNRGHRIFYEAIKEFASGRSSAIDDRILEEDEKSKTYSYINNLKDSIGSLKEHGFIENRANLSSLSIVAWDMGRLILLSRCCYECGYLDEEETWDYIMSGNEKCKEHYLNWKELATGYIVGRSMWSGNNMALWGIMDIAKGLLKDEQSPWLKYTFK